MPYDAPGFADTLSAALRTRWNEAVVAAYENLANLHSRFFTIDPNEISNAINVPVLWVADPAEPNFCFDEETARQLSDWGSTGRENLHNEYCEYVVIEQIDTNGQLRPKRVHITTELREYWLTIAMHDPVMLQDMAAQSLGFTPRFQELYFRTNNPLSLTPEQRRILFAAQVAGHGNDQSLSSIGVPAQPIGALNRDNALFMTHPINGLDDLLYIVLFGARPYAQMFDGNRLPATKEQIFRQFGVEHLACRHADPAAATAAHQQAYNGRRLAFANPLGVYINENTFTKGVFQIPVREGDPTSGNDVSGDIETAGMVGELTPIPDEWVRFKRGQGELFQRLEFGPSDEEDWFLDDIVIVQGKSQRPLMGGYDVVSQLEVGPLLSIAQSDPVGDNEYIVLGQTTAPIACHEAGICRQIRQLKNRFDNEQALNRVAPRQMGEG